MSDRYIKRRRCSVGYKCQVGYTVLLTDLKELNNNIASCLEMFKVRSGFAGTRRPSLAVVFRTALTTCIHSVWAPTTRNFQTHKEGRISGCGYVDRSAGAYRTARKVDPRTRINSWPPTSTLHAELTVEEGEGIPFGLGLWLPNLNVI